MRRINGHVRTIAHIDAHPAPVIIRRWGVGDAHPECDAFHHQIGGQPRCRIADRQDGGAQFRPYLGQDGHGKTQTAAGAAVTDIIVIGISVIGGDLRRLRPQQHAGFRVEHADHIAPPVRVGLGRARAERLGTEGCTRIREGPGPDDAHVTALKGRVPALFKQLQPDDAGTDDAAGNGHRWHRPPF